MILNISTYLFTPLEDLSEFREKLLEKCLSHELKGTILIAPEGINMFLAGQEQSVRDFFQWLHQDSRFANIETKDSWSSNQPFKKMLVKIKTEIIRMNHPSVQPSTGRAPSVKPVDLQRWLAQGHDDAGRPIVLLDTRNTFEVHYGTFDQAIHFDIPKFSDFPEAIKKHKEEFKDKTIVSFCTGGIRCEKANLFMREIGLKNSVQLDGGILKYFEEVGKDHYTGDCFVFDERVALDPALNEHPPAD
jgi:UPF0176 protein